MTDELTPEEKEALKNLPRERMPGAALEGRVVGAMRERGFLARTRHTVALTGGRVATLVAASVALMFGAYSIGLHRGGGTPALSPPTSTLSGERDRAETLAEAPPAKRPVVDDLRKADQPVAEETPAAEAPEKKSAVPVARSDEAAADAARQDKAEADALASRGRQPPASSPPEEQSAEGALNRANEPAPARLAMESARVSKAPRTFMLNGVPVTIEAPDSVRVTEDEQGKMLLIYTSDGIIRIRLGGDR